MFFLLILFTDSWIVKLLLSKLMTWPEAFSYLFRNFRRHLRLLISPLQKIMVSSTKLKLLIRGLPLGWEKGFREPSTISFWRPLLSTSTTSTKRLGERGSPYFRPVFDLKKPSFWPLMRIENQLLNKELQALSIKISEK